MDWMLSLREQLGIPHRLGDIGVDDARLDEVAAMAVVDPSAGGNPISLDVQNCRQMLEASLEGRVTF